MSREMRGAGNVFQRGAVWWIRYSYRGEVHRESAHSSERKDAVKLLKRRISETCAGRVIGASAEKVTLAEMAEALVADYKLRGNRSLYTAQLFARQLIAFFGENRRALDITVERIAAYIDARQKAGLSNATINRETACLRRMFNIMVHARRLSRDHVPSVPRLEEAEPRSGFLEPAEFSRLRDELPAYLKDAVTFLYLTGWRVSAMRSLVWSRDVELDSDRAGAITGGTIRLQAANSKNKRPWTLKLTGGLLEVIRSAWANRIAECEFVFHNESGLPIGDFRKAWRNACRAAGFEGLLVHDMRRSCARNLVRAGVSERIAMSVTGHLTRSMFDRYNIVADSDLENAMARMSAYVEERAAETPKIVPLKRTRAA